MGVTLIVRQTQRPVKQIVVKTLVFGHGKKTKVFTTV